MTPLTALLLLAADPADGFRPLFNGKDLSGWRYDSKPQELKAPPREDADGKAKTSDGRFEFADGVLLVREKATGPAPFKLSANTALYWNVPLKEAFTLRLEFRCKVDPQRVGKKENSGLYFGRQCQLQIDADTKNARTGVFAGLTKFRRDDWNALEVVVKDGKGVVYCNGELCPSPRAKVSVAAGDLLGIQAEHGDFHYRNVAIKMDR